MNDDRSTLVYATGIGKVVPSKPTVKPPAGDGVVRISLKRLGGNKVSSLISGLALGTSELESLARDLKRKCGTGGTVKDFRIEIQGDKREGLRSELERRGFKVKLSGG